MAKARTKRAYLVAVTRLGQADEVYVAVSRCEQEAIDVVAEQLAGKFTARVVGAFARELAQRLKLRTGDVQLV